MQELAFLGGGEASDDFRIQLLHAAGRRAQWHVAGEHAASRAEDLLQTDEAGPSLFLPAAAKAQDDKLRSGREKLRAKTPSGQAGGTPRYTAAKGRPHYTNKPVMLIHP